MHGDRKINSFSSGFFFGGAVRLDRTIVRLILIGDIVGKPGRQILAKALPGLRKEHRLDFVVANAENAAGGSGLTPAIYQELRRAGVDCITMGDHVYRRSEIYNVLSSENTIVRPANFPTEAPGRVLSTHEPLPGKKVAVFCLLGRVFMQPVDCFLKAADQILSRISPDVKIILIDFHAEATSDMQTLGRYLDGRVSAVLGTHTHVATADECIFPGGTAFQCDVGMTGGHRSILGRKIERVVETTRTFRPSHFEVVSDDNRICGTIVEVAPETGKAVAVERLVVDEADAGRLAEFDQP
jgi:metallophosphoesterase (TIGR00282 family)